MIKRRIFCLISGACYLVFAFLGIVAQEALSHSFSDGIEGLDGYGGLIVGLLLLLLYAFFLGYAILGILALVFKAVHFIVGRRWPGVVCLILDVIYLQLHGALLLSAFLDREISVGTVAFLLLTALSVLSIVMNAKSLSELEKKS